ncbi:MAG: SIMPL domain-containing protein [Planctomycetes bacterium]|nr:SIMPL domain-containing protein [Planctomycetota bacterium]
MRSPVVPFAFLLLLLLLLPLSAQDAGLRGAAPEPPLIQRLQPPDAAAAERVITVEAVAEVRVVPSRLRLVFGASAIGANLPAASAAARNLVEQTKARLVATGVEAGAVDVDFIAAVPVYAWQVEKQGGRSVLAEHRTGTRVQYDLHVAVADECASHAAIEAATATDGVDLLAVDYWSDDLDGKRVEAQQQALAAAQQKAKLLLSVFAEPPKPINVHESTRVWFPQQLYQTLPRVEDSAESWYERDLPRIAASRPLLVYYRGLFGDIDAGVATLPGRREIEVVSTVRLYFLAPERPAVVVGGVAR